MSKFRSLESKIRDVLSTQEQINENAILHISEPNRVDDALKVLHDNGVSSAKKKDDKTITVAAGDLLTTATILDQGIFHGLIKDKPIIVSDEAIAEPESNASVPEPVVKEGVNDPAELDQGEVEKDGEVELRLRTLHNRRENQMKKIDEVYHVVGKMNGKPWTTKKGILTQSAADKEHERLKSAGLTNSKVVSLKSLDETSTGMLNSYISKARKNIDDTNDSHANDVKTHGFSPVRNAAKNAKIDKRHSGIMSAVRKIAKNNIGDKLRESSSSIDLILGKIKSLRESKNTPYVKPYKTPNGENGWKASNKHGKLKFFRHEAKSSAYKHAGISEEVDQIDELSKNTLSSYVIKSSASKKKNEDKAELAKEEIDLTESKKEEQAELAKSEKKFASHPRADKMYADMTAAAKHYNYVTDAVDHVYNNNVKHVKYSDWADMKPHVESYFVQRGLEY